MPAPAAPRSAKQNFPKYRSPRRASPGGFVFARLLRCKTLAAEPSRREGGIASRFPFHFIDLSVAASRKFHSPATVAPHTVV
jgi:hypothetical protein